MTDRYDCNGHLLKHGDVCIAVRYIYSDKDKKEPMLSPGTQVIYLHSENEDRIYFDSIKFKNCCVMEGPQGIVVGSSNLLMKVGNPENKRVLLYFEKNKEEGVEDFKSKLDEWIKEGRDLFSNKE